MSLNKFITSQQVEAVRLPLEDASVLPFNCYADPEFHDFEVEQVFMKNWLAVGRVEQVDEIGKYFTRDLFGEPIVVLRNEQGSIRALSNVCRHRGRVVMEGSGSCKNQRMTCPYHAWSYSLDGQLAAAPHMEQSKGFKCANHRMPELAVDIWQGFIFVNFDRNAQPLSPQLKTLDKVLDNYRIGEMACVDFESYQGRWNWKATMDNFTEAYHQPLVHSSTIEPWVPSTQAIYEDVDGPYNLFHLYTGDGNQFLTVLPPIVGLAEPCYRRTTVVNIFPHFHLLIDSSSVMWLDWEIRGVDDHDLVWKLLAPKDSIGASDFAEQKKELHTLLRPVWAEDEDACNGLARGLRSRFADPGRMSHMEKSLHQFYNWLIDQYENR